MLLFVILLPLSTVQGDAEGSEIQILYTTMAIQNRKSSTVFTQISVGPKLTSDWRLDGVQIDGNIGMKQRGII